MLELWEYFSLLLGDALLGWMLQLPSDVALFALALMTSGLMVLVRPLVTNQDMLRRVDDDRRCLKERMRQAKKGRDWEALSRYRTTWNALAMRKLAAEGKPLLIAILPVAILATWAMARLQFHPPAEGEEVELVAYMVLEDKADLTAVGETVHLVPQPSDLEAPGGWVQMIESRPNEPSWWERLLVWLKLADPVTHSPDAVARWTVKGKARPEAYTLVIPFRDEIVKRRLLIGQPTYSDPIQDRDIGTPEEDQGWARLLEMPFGGAEEEGPEPAPEHIILEIKMRPVQLFGIVPGLGNILPGWLVGYIIIVLPLVFVLKWALRIY